MRSPAAGTTEPTTSSPGDLAVQRTDDSRLTFGSELDGGRGPGDPQTPDASVDLPPGQMSIDAQARHAGGAVSGGEAAQSSNEARVAVGADPSDALLLILADALDDLERTRIANENRLRSLRQVKGLGGSRAESKLEVLTASLAKMEHSATLELQRAMRDHPLGPWVKRTIGIGEKQAARLIAAIGDPAWNHADDRLRRGPAELWAYCGYAPGQKRTKGVKSNWNADAKMRAHLCAESCVKQMHSPYRKVYDDARANWAEKDTSDGHKHAHALRLVAKAILRDLWVEARALRGSEPDVEALAPAHEVAA